MKNILFVINLTLITVATLISSLAQSEELLSLKDFLKKELSASTKLSKESFTLNNEQKESLKKIASGANESDYTFFYGRTDSGTLQKVCTSVPSQGKEGPMTLGICFEPNGLVQSVTILTFEEERGKRANDIKFLSQFNGKSSDSPIEVGKDIHGITGATHTSKAISEGVRKASFTFKTFVLKK